MSEISAAELGERLFNGGPRPLLVDIRHPDEFEAWHIPGSENIDVYDELQADPAAAAHALSRLPNGREIVTVCAAGVVSEHATDLLNEQGYDAKTLVDGLKGWSRVHRAAPVRVDMDGTLLQVARPGKGCLSYILISDGAAAVFDPSHYPAEYEARIAEHDATLVGVFDSHGHADHISGGRTLATRNNVPYHLHPADASAIHVTTIEDGETVTVGNVDVEVLHTPGHSPGSVTYSIAGEALLTGDTLFHGSVGRVELGVEAGIEDTNIKENATTLYHSLQRLRRQAGDSLVLPAHDPGTPEPPVAAPMSTVERHNQDLRLAQAEFVEKLATDIPEHPPNFHRVKRVNLGLESVDTDELTDLESGPNRCAIE